MPCTELSGNAPDGSPTASNHRGAGSGVPRIGEPLGGRRDRVAVGVGGLPGKSPTPTTAARVRSLHVKRPYGISRLSLTPAMDETQVAGGTGASRPTTLDELALALRELRADAGDPSYAEIARRVVLARRAAGQTEAEARLARTTVYDVFRFGRRRVDTELVLQIVRALGVDDEGVGWWALACREARQGTAAAPAALAAPAPDPEPVPAPVPEASPVPTPEAVPAPLPVPDPPPASSAAWTGGLLLLVLGLCVLGNLAGRLLVSSLGLTVHLDMGGTAVAAMLLGPWWGVAVGVSTNALGSLVDGVGSSMPFAVVNAAGALVWGYGVRRWRLGRTLPRFLGLNLLVAVVCSLVAVPVLAALGGSVGHGSDQIVDNLRAAVGSPVLALLGANLVTSWADKMISGFLALVVVASVPFALRGSAVLPTLGGAPAPPHPRAPAPG